MRSADAPTRPLVALVLVQLLFASLAVAGKYAFDHHVPPFALAAVRVFLAAVILAAAALRMPVRVARGDLPALFGLALLGVVFNQLLFLKGLELTSVVNVGLLLPTIPIFTFLVAVALRREHFNAARALGIVVALAGAFVLLRAESFDLSNRTALGNLLIVLNSLSYSFYLVLSRPLLERYPPGLVVAWTFLFGALLMIPIGANDVAGAYQAGLFTLPILAAVLWIVAGPTVGSYRLNNYALRHLPASTVGVYVFLQPVFTILLALLFRPDEHLTLRDGLGGALILAGVLLVSRTQPESTRARTQTAISEPPI